MLFKKQRIIFKITLQLIFVCHEMHLFEVCKPLVCNILTKLCNHPHCLILEHFCHPRNTLPLVVTPHTLQPQPLATTNLLPVCMDLPAVEISHKLNPPIRGILYLPYFTYHVFKGHSCCGMCISLLFIAE